jgi:hypothetical protein
MRGGTRFEAPRVPKFIVTQGAAGKDDAKKPKQDDKARAKRHDGGNARGFNEIILANKNTSAVQIQESVKEKGFSAESHQQRSAAEIHSHSPVAWITIMWRYSVGG